MSIVRAFRWNDQDYFYSPDHHKIFSSSDIPALLFRSTENFPGDVHIDTLYLNLSEGCNLNCEYCFNPPKDRFNSRIMSHEIARGAVMKLAEWYSEHPTKQANIVFFGGEPLLNREVLEYVIHFSQEWGREFGIPFSYSISTNATLLTTRDIDLFNRENVTLWVSIDGPAELHDRFRHFRNGSGSHAIAIKNALYALEILGPDRVGVRATLPTGVRELSRIIEYFASLGFRTISVKAVDSRTNNHLSLREQNLEIAAINLDKCAAELLRWIPHGLKCYPFDQDMISLKTGHVDRFVCSAGSGSLTVDTEGWLYPCHRFVGNPRYRLGHARGEICLESCRDFAALDISYLTICNECWARKFCLGSCPAISATMGNALGYPDHQTCEQKEFYALIALKCAVAQGLIYK